MFWVYGCAAVTVVTRLQPGAILATAARFIAVRDDEIAAEAMGIDTTRYKVTAFVVSLLFAGLAGGVYAHFQQYSTPQGFGFDEVHRDHRDDGHRRHGQHRRA